MVAVGRLPRCVTFAVCRDVTPFLASLVVTLAAHQLWLVKVHIGRNFGPS